MKQHETRPLVQEPPPPPAPKVAPVTTTMRAMPPALVQPAPVTTTVRPVQTTAVPVTTAVPSVSYAVPTFVPRQMTAMELFDQLDVNKDGRVSREEFSRAAAARGIPI